MQQLKHFLGRYKYWLFGLGIFSLVLLRVWDFADGMLLKGDQIRDAVMASRAYEGDLGDLSLLGPRAGGTKLRLGPAFYYFQSAAALTFDSLQPWVLALPNLLFSLLAIPLFFLLTRFYFSKNISLGLTLLFASSFLGFEYARFAWNPNSVPFFVLLFLYAWLKIFNHPARQNFKWFLLLGAAAAIASQLHFTSLIALGLFAVLFLLIKRQSAWHKIGLINLAAFLGIILLLYVPVILSDILNRGDNLQLFFKSISGKSSDHSWLANLFKEFYYFGEYYLRLATGYFGNLKVLHYLGGVLLLGGVWLNWQLLRQETEKPRRNFLLVILLWTLTFGMLYFPLAYEIDKPRFFLPLLFLPYVHLGFLAKSDFGKFKTSLVGGLGLLLLLTNLAGSVLWLVEFSRAAQGELNAKNTIILKAKKDPAWWSWGMIKKTTQIMSDNCAGGAVYFFSPAQTAEFADVFDWAFKLNGETRPYGFTKKISAEKKGCVFVVAKQNYNPRDVLDWGEFRKIGSAGDIALWKVMRTPELEKVDVVARVEELPVVEGNSLSDFPTGVHQRAYWKDIKLIFNF